jgi:hypothetical protein
MNTAGLPSLPTKQPMQMDLKRAMKAPGPTDTTGDFDEKEGGLQVDNKKVNKFSGASLYNNTDTEEPVQKTYYLERNVA